MVETDLERTKKTIAAAFGVPEEVLGLSDAEFHHWLHHSEDGRRLLEAE